MRSGKPSAARAAGRGDSVLRRGAGAVPVRVSAGGAALSDGGSQVGVVGRGAAGVGQVIDFARQDALGVSAVRGAARCPGGAGGGLGDARGVVSRAAPGGVRRVDAERARRGDEPGGVRGARGVAWPRSLPAGADSSPGGGGHAGGVCLAGGRVWRIGGCAGRGAAAAVVRGDAGAGGPGLLQLPALAAGGQDGCRPALAHEDEPAPAGARALRRWVLPQRAPGQRPGPSAQPG